MTEQTDTTPQSTQAAHSALTFDPEAFREHVEGMDLSRSQQDALLEAVWLIVVGVIDFGFGPHRFSDSRRDAKALVGDSATVLGSIIISNREKEKDARAGHGLVAARKDS